MYLTVIGLFTIVELQPRNREVRAMAKSIEFGRPPRSEIGMKINSEESGGSGSKDQKWTITVCQRDVLAATKSCGVVRPTDILDSVTVISGIPLLNPMTKETAKSQQPRYRIELLK